MFISNFITIRILVGGGQMFGAPLFSRGAFRSPYVPLLPPQIHQARYVGKRSSDLVLINMWTSCLIPIKSKATGEPFGHILLAELNIALLRGDLGNTILTITYLT